MSENCPSSVATLADAGRSDSAWWVAVARTLDELEERLAQDALQDDGPSGAFGEAVSRAPSLANETTRISADRLRILERARRLRRLVAKVAGEPGHAADVSSELDDLAREEGRYRRRARNVFWESFTRDVGGE